MVNPYHFMMTESEDDLMLNNHGQEVEEFKLGTHGKHQIHTRHKLLTNKDVDEIEQI